MKTTRRLSLINKIENVIPSAVAPSFLVFLAQNFIITKCKYFASEVRYNLVLIVLELEKQTCIIVVCYVVHGRHWGWARGEIINNIKIEPTVVGVERTVIVILLVICFRQTLFQSNDDDNNCNDDDDLFPV